MLARFFLEFTGMVDVDVVLAFQMHWIARSFIQSFETVDVDRFVWVLFYSRVSIGSHFSSTVPREQVRHLSAEYLIFF
jgi:hypothetical protein